MDSFLKFPHGTVKHVECKKKSRSVKASCAPLLLNEFGITQTKGKQLGTQYVQRVSYSGEVEDRGLSITLRKISLHVRCAFSLAFNFYCTLSL